MSIVGINLPVQLIPSPTNLRLHIEKKEAAVSVHLAFT